MSRPVDTRLKLIRIAVSCFFALLSAGCPDKSPKAPADAGVAPQPPKAEAVGLEPKLPLFDQLALEQKLRPKDTPSLEQLQAALAKDGMTLDQVQQNLGRTYGAAYCANARTTGVYLVVCEFASGADADKGAASLAAVFRDRGGMLHRQKNSVLVVLPDAASDGGGPEGKVLAAFQSL
jgi:hypothetical protein